MNRTAKYQVVQIDADSWRIEDSDVRCFLFCGRDRALLVDTGLGTGDLRAVVEELTTLPLMVVNTHADVDHVGCNGQFPEVWMHPADFERYQTGRDVPPPLPLWEGTDINLGGRRFHTILIPGHTPGSIALLDEERYILVAGDSVLGEHVFLFGPGRNLAAYVESLHKLLAMGDRFDTVYPSHGPFPLRRDALECLAEGARAVQSGGLTFSEAEVMGVPVAVYDAGGAKLLRDR